MRFAQFFNSLIAYHKKSNDINYLQAKKTMDLLFKAMTDSETTRYEFYYWKVLSSIVKQLVINDFEAKKE